MTDSLIWKTVLGTGAARRLGRLFVRTCARNGANVVIHHARCAEEAQAVRTEIAGLGRKAWVFRQTRAIHPQPEIYSGSEHSRPIARFRQQRSDIWFRSTTPQSFIPNIKELKPWTK